MMEANGCPNSLKPRRIRAYLTGLARDWLELVTLRSPDLEWQAFKKRFIEDFSGIDVVQQAKKQLGTATQESSEHPYTFAVRVLGLCRRANPQMSEEEKIMYCLQDLSESLRNTLACLRSRKDWDLDDLLQLLAAQTKGAGAETSRQPSNYPRQPRGGQTIPKATRTEDRSAWTCFNCGSKDHLAKDCKAPAKEKKPVEANPVRDPTLGSTTPGRRRRSTLAHIGYGSRVGLTWGLQTTPTGSGSIKPVPQADTMGGGYSPCIR